MRKLHDPTITREAREWLLEQCLQHGRLGVAMTIIESMPTTPDCAELIAELRREEKAHRCAELASEADLYKRAADALEKQP